MILLKELTAHSVVLLIEFTEHGESQAISMHCHTRSVPTLTTFKALNALEGRIHIALPYISLRALTP